MLNDFCDNKFPSMKNAIFYTLFLLIASSVYSQYTYGLDLEQHDAKIDGKLNLNTDGNSIYIGENAGINHTGINDQNVVIGYNSGLNLTSANSNTFVGFETGKNIKTNFGNTFFGGLAGRDAVFGAANTFIGYLSGSQFISGIGNVFIGSNSGQRLFTGDYNLILGSSAGPAISTTSGGDLGNYNVYIGNEAGNALFAGNSYQLVIEAGDNDPSTQMIYGEFDTDRIGINWNLNVPLSATFSVNGSSNLSGIVTFQDILQLKPLDASSVTAYLLVPRRDAGCTRYVTCHIN